MKKRMQKFITVLGATWIALFSMMPVSAMELSVDTSLQTAIIEVKETITVPEELTEFEYQVRTDTETGKTYYYLSWYDKAYEKGSVSIRVNQKGNILNYEQRLYTTDDISQISLAYEDGIKKAEEFIHQVITKMDGEIVIGEYIAPGQGSTYTYAFDHLVNGVKVFGESILVEVDKRTGEVIRFSGIESFEGEYAKTNDPIDLEKAKALYAQKVEIPLMYKLTSDYKTKTIRSFPLYWMRDLGAHAIDASSGEVFTPQRDDRYQPYPMSLDKGGEESAAGSMGLTESEQMEVDAAKNLLQPQQIVEDSKAFFKNLEKFTIGQTNLSKNVYTGEYIWQINLEPKQEGGGYSYLQANAKTGEILSYYGHLTKEESKPEKISYKEAKQQAQALLQKLAPKEYKQTKEVEQTEEMGQLYDEEDAYYTFEYQRQVEGTPVEGNQLSISYSVEQGGIVSYNKAWNDVDFTALNKVVSKDQIVEALNVQLRYVTNEKGVRVLAYISEEGNMAFEPFEGKRINAYDGSLYQEETTGMYQDMENHPANVYVKGLMDRGIRLNGENFKPDTKVTQVDFLRLLMGLTDLSWDEESIAENAVTRGILTKEQVDLSQEVTIEEGMRYMIHHLGYKKVAQIQGIFKLPIQNHTITQENVGYAALAHGLELIEDEDLQQNQQEAITRAKAAQMIYYMLQNH